MLSYLCMHIHVKNFSAHNESIYLCRYYPFWHFSEFIQDETDIVTRILLEDAGKTKR